MSTTASHSPLNISKIVRDRGLVPKALDQGNGLREIEWSRDRWRRVTVNLVTPIRLELISWKSLTSGGIFSNHFITSFLQNVPVKKICKSANIWRRYGQRCVAYFLGHPVDRLLWGSIWSAFCCQNLVFWCHDRQNVGLCWRETSCVFLFFSSIFSVCYNGHRLSKTVALSGIEPK